MFPTLRLARPGWAKAGAAHGDTGGAKAASRGVPAQIQPPAPACLSLAGLALGIAAPGRGRLPSAVGRPARERGHGTPASPLPWLRELESTSPADPCTLHLEGDKPKSWMTVLVRP